MSKLSFESELHEFFRWRAHVFEALPKRHDGEAHTLKVLAHLERAPPIVSDLANIKPLAELLDDLFDVDVVDHVALRSF